MPVLKLRILVLLTAVLPPISTKAQQPDTEPSDQAARLATEALDAYSESNLEMAVARIEEALGFAPELERTDLAMLYLYYGIFEIGGFGDNAKGKRNFTIAQCLDPSIEIPPERSSPDVELLFRLAKQKRSVAKCLDLLSSITLPLGPGNTTMFPWYSGPIAPAVPPCGNHHPPEAQRRQYEVPLVVETSSEFVNRLARMVIRYAFDGARQFGELPMSKSDTFFFGMITCDEGQLRVYDPSVVSYYLEGYDSSGNLVCGHASSLGPFILGMMPDEEIIQGLPGKVSPRECTPCPPWDPECGETLKPGLGETCEPTIGCKNGLFCGDAELCEERPLETEKILGPSTFYIGVGGGIGFGVTSNVLEYNAVSLVEGADGNGLVFQIDRTEQTVSGAKWSGIPLRFIVGLFLTKRLSLEASGRFDMVVGTTSEARSVWQACNQDPDCMENATCHDYPSNGEHPDNEAEYRKAVALTASPEEGGEVVQSRRRWFAWHANARLRYLLTPKSAFRHYIFAGVGWGYVKYKSGSKHDMNGDGKNDNAYSMVGPFNIEAGAGMSYFLTEHFGFFFEIPIDFMVGDGWAFNFDFNLGLSYGF